MSMVRTLVVLLVLGSGANTARAQDIANLQRLIQAGEQTLAAEPYLPQYCAQLVNGDAFLHRGRQRAGKPPVVALARWDAYVNQQVGAGQMTRAQGDALIQEARRRRNEVVNACNLENNRALLARARQPAPGASGPAQLIWNQDTDGNRVIHADGTITGNAAGWQFTGTGIPTWRPQIRAPVTCSGNSVGLSQGGRENGTLTCRTEWNEGGRRHVRECRGPGAGRAYGYNATKAWFVAWPRRCVGTVTGPDGRPVNQEFGYTIFPVLSQDSPFNWAP